MKKMFVVLLCVLFSISLLCGFFVFGSGAKNAGGTAKPTQYEQMLEQSQDNPYRKVHVYAGEEGFATIDSKEELERAVACLYEYRNTYEFDDPRFWMTVQFDSGFGETVEYQKYAKQKNMGVTKQEFKKLKEDMYPYSYQYHEDIAKKGIESLEFLDYDEIEIYHYSPFVLFKLADITVEDILRMIEMEYVKNISFYFELTPVSTVNRNDTLTEIDAKNIVESGLYSGNNISVGIYESGGVCDTGHANLRDKNIFLKSGSTTITNHATEITSIVAL